MITYKDQRTGAPAVASTRLSVSQVPPLGASVSPTAVATLQRSVGNHATARLLQRSITAPGDVTLVREYFDRRVMGLASVTSRGQRTVFDGILQDSNTVEEAKQRIDRHVKSLSEAIDDRGPAELKRRGRLSVRNFIPKTGMGIFDADYDPEKGRLEVTLRVAFDFAFETPPEGQGRLAAAAHLVGLFVRSLLPAWSEHDATAWRQTFVSEVKRGWSDKHRFAANEFGWDLPTVGVTVQAQDVASNPHFRVIVHRQYDQTRLYSAYNETDQLFDPTVERRVHYQQHDLQSTPHTGARQEVTGRTVPGLTGALREIATQNRDVGDDPSKLYLMFDPSSVLTAPSQRKLKGVVDTFGRIPTPLPAKLVLYYDTREHLNTVADALAGVTLRSEQLQQPQVAGVQLIVAADPSFQPRPYSTAVHEFGHMLGNVDIYRDEAKQLQEVLRRNPGADVRIQRALEGAQTNWLELVNKAGVKTKAPVVGIASNDVMSMGDIVMPSDYVTLWEALTSITSPEVTHWRIV